MSGFEALKSNASRGWLPHLAKKKKKSGLRWWAPHTREYTLARKKQKGVQMRGAY